jgi:phosphatidylethanolamine/phosphatidyl-N-methylethanolamine N-methyltransferase
VEEWLLSLFKEESAPDTEILATSDEASRALSVTAVKTDFVEKVYGNLASVYDVFFGPTLHAGRLEAIRSISIKPGDKVLEVGVGTAINATLYPRHCSVIGVDLSASMLEKAARRIQRHNVSNMQLLQMDAADLKFQDESFDTVYAPYLMSVVPDPVQVAREMVRVCRTGGRVVFLNHFKSENPVLSRIEQLLSPMTVHVGFKLDLDMQAFFAQTGINPESIKKVNVPRMWSLVSCIKGE